MRRIPGLQRASVQNPWNGLGASPVSTATVYEYSVILVFTSFYRAAKISASFSLLCFSIHARSVAVRSACSGSAVSNIRRQARVYEPILASSDLPLPQPH